jgi:guanylate kinase
VIPHSSVYVVTAPSGTGKTTLNRRLIQDIPDLTLSVSHTTRPVRPGEINGDHYWFTSVESFKEDIEHHKMLEWAEVFGNYYGTSLSELNRIHQKGCRALLEIDVQGWAQARVKIPEALGIFILPPSISDLWKRLSARGTDSLPTRIRRLKTARKELDHSDQYQFFILNDDLDSAYQELKNLIQGTSEPKLDFSKGLAFSKKLKEEFDSAHWIKEIEQNLGS